MPLTIPRIATEVPTADKEQWPGVGGRSLYTEKLNVGYRWYDKTNTPPLFPFGFGLSYTTFRLSHLVVEPAVARAAGPGEEPIHVKVDVTNTGQRKGAEVVQVYVGDPPANDEPPHQLRGFAKVVLAPGETKTVRVVLGKRSFETWDSGAHEWKIRAGTYQILAGTSSRDLPLTGTVDVQ